MMYCQHCGKGKPYRRNLCTKCYEDENIRPKYPSSCNRNPTKCAHCKHFARHRRGLCNRCYHDLDIRAKYWQGGQGKKLVKPVKPEPVPPEGTLFCIGCGVAVKVDAALIELKRKLLCMWTVCDKCQAECVTIDGRTAPHARKIEFRLKGT